MFAHELIARFACAALLSALVGCVESRTVRCPNGTVCAAGLSCDEAIGCVDPLFCEGLADDTLCLGPGVPEGGCVGGACKPVVCGDGQMGRGETCDDRNLLSHDGCSSGCRSEQPTWSEVTPEAGSPAPRDGHAMAYDAARGRVVLFGGYDGSSLHGDTWEWDGAAWTEVTPAAGSPVARLNHAMAYDAARGRVVLFGGNDLSSPVATSADTWEWDGAAWTEVTPAAGSPPARLSHAMAYDAARGRVVLFGGFDGSSPRADTWTWDGAAWTEVTPAAGPPPARLYHALAYNAARGRVVLFGGYNNGATLGDTWEWDGAAWAELTPVADPPRARSGHALSYDAALGRVVLFGGFGRLLLNDTWESNGAVWTEATPATGSPPGRVYHAMIYDAARGELVLFGGSSDPTYGDTWHFQYQADDADEDCTAGIDADGDGALGCDDPDCWAYCTPSCPPGAACDPDAPRCGDDACNPALETCALCPGDCGACP